MDRLKSFASPRVAALISQRWRSEWDRLSGFTRLILDAES